MGENNINKDLSNDKDSYNLTDIYNILYSIDTDSLRKIANGKIDELDDKIKAKISEVKKIAKELGWNHSGLYRGYRSSAGEERITQ